MKNQEGFLKHRFLAQKTAVVGVFLSVCLCGTALAQGGARVSQGISSAPSTSLSVLVKNALAGSFARADIHCATVADVEKNLLQKFTRITSVRLVEAKPNGVAILEVSGQGARAEDADASQIIQVPFEAWVSVPVATHRIFPNTKLKNEDFKVQSVNVASGMGHEFRGVLADEKTNFDKMESTQSILAGQFVVSNAIRKQPDIRRGEMVKLELMSGDLLLTTQAVAQEPGSVGDDIRVLATKTKKEIMGKIQKDHSVEVDL